MRYKKGGTYLTKKGLHTAASCRSGYDTMYSPCAALVRHSPPRAIRDLPSDGFSFLSRISGYISRIRRLPYFAPYKELICGLPGEEQGPRFLPECDSRAELRAVDDLLSGGA